jgi:hypothetical protein
MKNTVVLPARATETNSAKFFVIFFCGKLFKKFVQFKTAGHLHNWILIFLMAAFRISFSLIAIKSFAQFFYRHSLIQI